MNSKKIGEFIRLKRLQEELKDLLLGEEKKNITSEDILINELKIKKRKNILTLIFGIII